MLPILAVPQTVMKGLSSYRDIFCKDAGFESIGRYITGLILSPNKTLQGIHGFQCYSGCSVSRRSMHEAVFETNWDDEKLMVRHRQNLSLKYSSGKGKSAISLDWTFGHHESGKHIFGVKKQWDYVNNRYSFCQTIPTATISNNTSFDPIDIEIQEPKHLQQEKKYLDATVKESYSSQEETREKLLQLLHYNKHQKEYKTIHELFVEMIDRIEEENQFPESDYAFDNGVLNLKTANTIEQYQKNWVSELELSRNVLWNQKWTRVDQVAELLKKDHPNSFKKQKIRLRDGTTKEYLVFTKVLRLKKHWGRKRIAIVFEKEDLSDSPRVLISNATHWNGVKILKLWNYRWPCEIFHNFGKNISGLENAQVRKKESVKKQLRLACLSQSILNQTEVHSSTREEFSFAKGAITIGQKVKSIAREVLESLVCFTKDMLDRNKNVTEILNQLMPI